jgi:hypothetical protein
MCPKEIRSSRRCFSQAAFQKPVQIDGCVPAGQEADAVLHAPKLSFAAIRGRRSNLGDRTAMARDNHLLAALDHPDQFSEAILGFCGTDVHASILAIFSGYCKQFSAAKPVPGCAGETVSGREFKNDHDRDFNIRDSRPSRPMRALPAGLPAG